MNSDQWISILLFLSLVSSAAASDFYVSLYGQNQPPFTNWNSAATNIQDAVDLATDGDIVWVTNGVYRTGGRVIQGPVTTRVAITNAIFVKSVNGPAVTLIEGWNWSTFPTRCVYLASGAVLSGFTLTNGATATAGTTAQEAGGAVWAESSAALITNCVLVNNSAQLGGAAYGGTLKNCVIRNNSASDGGGTYAADLWDCTLESNNATRNGGAAYSGTLNRCSLRRNSAYGFGGGTSSALLTNCVLEDNLASYGGGAASGSLCNCVLSRNTARNGFGYNSTFFAYGGGADSAQLNNCTLTGNSAWNGGGASRSQLTNCILYYNKATNGSNYYQSTLAFCCTAPPPPNGVNNVESEPQLASASHISAGSPCRGAGNSSTLSGVDIDGDVWLQPPSIGCDEYVEDALSGSLSISALASWTNVAIGFPVEFVAVIDGKTGESTWDFGDGTIVTNQPYISHAFMVPGIYPVILSAYNRDYPEGLRCTNLISVLERPVHYVALSSTNPSPPYVGWETAAHSLQDAVDAATLPGALVLVSNGVYSTGGQLVGSLSNRVALQIPITVRSLNGPGVTTIQGYQVPLSAFNFVRCAYLTNGAILSGFTLTNGSTMLANDLLYLTPECVGGGAFCESVEAIITNCVITGNRAGTNGGGVWCGTVLNSVLKGNAAYEGGGTYDSIVQNCSVAHNSAVSGGGGAAEGILINSVIYGNKAYAGGGAGGAVLNNCTVTGNSAYYGGGLLQCTFNNSIVYYNDLTTPSLPLHGSDSYLSVGNFSCISAKPQSGTNNFYNPPQLASVSHITAGSPCRGAGSPLYSVGQDIDGEAWSNPPSVGCDELLTNGLTGELVTTIQASWTNVPVSFPVRFVALIEGEVATSTWDFGDGSSATNQPYVTHAWSAVGNYPVTLTAHNRSHPEGVTATVIIQVLDPLIHYVSATSTNPVAPYASWDTAAQSIQAAINAEVQGPLVIVGNGIYSNSAQGVYGSSNRVAITRPVEVRSLNGPEFTTIRGVLPNVIASSGIRCAYLTNGATLRGFTLTEGGNSNGGDIDKNMSGGGVWCESTNALIVNCVISNNTTYRYAAAARSGTLLNCLIVSNSSPFDGVVLSALLKNCTIAGNSGGGADSCSLFNSISYYNYSVSPPGVHNYSGGTRSFCCTTPLNTQDPGNISTAPNFMDLAHGNFRLQSSSPCINSGLNTYAAALVDLDGSPRISGGTVDIGAYELQRPLSQISYAWLQQFGLPTDGSADNADTDGDGLDNWQEWIAGTDPTNANSRFELVTITNSPAGLKLVWRSSTNRLYAVERSSGGLTSDGFNVICADIPGRLTITLFTDTNAPAIGPMFYRVSTHR